MKNVFILLTVSFLFSSTLFSQDKELLNIEGVSIRFSHSKYCEDFAIYGNSKVNYDVYKISVSLINGSLETKYYNHAEFGIRGEKGNCYTNFSVYSGRRGFPSGEKVQKIFYVYVVKGADLPDPQYGLKLVLNDEQPQEPYSEFQCPCLKLPPCETKRTEENPNTFIDNRDGKTYRIVKIGNQVWMAENLNFAQTSNSWCYDNLSSNCDKYGRLYKGGIAQTICPAGWHLPSKEEYFSLLNINNNNDVSLEQARETFNNLISKGSSGFEALLSGCYHSDIKYNADMSVSDYTRYDFFDELNSVGFFWTSTIDKMNDNYFYQLEIVTYNGGDAAITTHHYKEWGLSVRCIKN